MKTARLVIPVFVFCLISEARALVCTKEDKRAYSKQHASNPPGCDLQRLVFRVSDDDCLTALQELTAVAPECEETSALTLHQRTRMALDDCIELRANATDKYMPQFSTNLTACSSEEVSEWNGLYGIGSDTARCGRILNGCSDDCLKTLEESVAKAPVCADRSGYWLGETKKKSLLLCVLARGEKLLDNAVLQTVVNGDGTSFRNAASLATSAPPKSNNSSTTSPTTSSPDIATSTSTPLPTSPSDRAAAVSRTLVLLGGAITVLVV